MPRKSLYICYFGVQEPLVQTQVLPYLREIQKDGIEVSILTFEPAEEDLRAKEKRNEEINKAFAAEGINWYRLRYHKRPSVPATAFDVINGARLVRSLVQKHGFDILHARSHVPMLMASLARKYSSSQPKILFDIRGFFPEEYVDAGIWSKESGIYKTVKRVERWLMREADGFVVLTNRAREILFPQSANESRPVEVIPCCVDLDRFRRANLESRTSLRREMGIGDRQVIVYVGAFGGWYLTEETAELFGTFKKVEPNGFGMILTQSNPEMIEPQLLKLGFSASDLLITKVDSKEIPRYLSAADIAVSLIKPSYSKQASSPTKNAEYLACGLPIIANSGVGDVDDQITRNNVGALFDEFTEDAYLTALREVEELGNIGIRCREVARREFDLESVGGVRYRSIYSELLAE